MTDDQLSRGVARENALRHALCTAAIGEDSDTILKRAEAYENYILGPLNETEGK